MSNFTENLNMEIVDDNTQKIRHVFIISCHGIESSQSESRYYYSVEDILFKDMGWISTGNNVNAYADEVNEKLFNSDQENSFDLFKTINTEVCVREHEQFSDNYITNLKIPPMLFEFRESDKDNNDRTMSERMGLYFATVEEENYTDEEGKEKVRYKTRNLEHLVHFNNLNTSTIPNVSIINEGTENHLETYFKFGQQHPWQKIFGMANKFLLKKMDDRVISEEDLNNNLYFRIFCCRASLRVDETGQSDRSMRIPELIDYNKYYKPLEKEMTENVYLYSETLNTEYYGINVASRLYNICFYSNPLSGGNLPINYDTEVLCIYYMLMININPYIAIPYINDNIPDYERQTIISFPSEEIHNTIYKLTAMLTREMDNKYWIIPLIALPLDQNSNNSYNLCKLISNVLLQEGNIVIDGSIVRRSYFIAYKNNPLDNENESGIILSIFGYVTLNELGQLIGVIEIIQYYLDRTFISSEFNEIQINNMLENNTHKITFTYDLTGRDLEEEKCNLVLNSFNQFYQDYGFTYIRLLFKEHIYDEYIGGMNNNRLSQYNPNKTEKNPYEKMEVVRDTPSNRDDIKLLTGQMYPRERQSPFQSAPAREENVKRYTKKDARYVFKLQPPSEPEPMELDPMDIEPMNIEPMNRNEVEKVLKATSGYYNTINDSQGTDHSQGTDPEFSTPRTPRTPDRPPTASYTTPNQQGIIGSVPSSDVSGRTTLPDSLPVSPNLSYLNPPYPNKPGPRSPGRKGRLFNVPSAPTSDMSDMDEESDNDETVRKLPPGSTGGKKQKVKSKKSSRKKNYVPIITSKKIKLTKKCYHKKKDCCCDVDKSKCSIHKCKPKNSKKQTKKKNKK